MKRFWQLGFIRTVAIKVLKWLAAKLDYDLTQKLPTNNPIISDVPIWRFTGAIVFPDSYTEDVQVEIEIKYSNKSRARSLAEKQAHATYGGYFIIDSEARVDTPQPKSRKVQRIEGEGYVYLIKSNVGHYKIGLTVQPVTRLARLDVTLPFDIEVLHLIHTDDLRRAEKQLHQTYAVKRVRGEWFALSESDVMAIMDIKELMFGVNDVSH